MHPAHNENLTFREIYCSAYCVKVKNFNCDLYSRSLKCNFFLRWAIRFILIKFNIQTYSTMIFTYLGDTTDAKQFDLRLRELCRFSKSNSNFIMKLFKITPSYSRIIRISRMMHHDVGAKFIHHRHYKSRHEKQLFESLGL